MSQPHSEPHAAATIAPTCPACGYSLRELPSDRCPECGLEITPEMRVASAIPWEHRRTIGAWRAYWGTVWMLNMRRTACHEALELPIQYGPARGFWWLTVIGVSAVIVTSIATQLLPVIGDAIGWVMVVGFLCSLPLSVLISTGALTYDCHPQWRSIQQQNRAIALGYYYSALWWPMALVCALSSLLFWWDRDPIGPGLTSASVFCVGLLLWVFHIATRQVGLVRYPPGEGRGWGCGWHSTFAGFLALGLPLIVPLLALYVVFVAALSRG